MVLFWWVFSLFLGYGGVLYRLFYRDFILGVMLVFFLSFCVMGINVVRIIFFRYLCWVWSMDGKL